MSFWHTSEGRAALAARSMDRQVLNVARGEEPPITSWGDLSAWVDRHLEAVESDLGDDETLQSIGYFGEARLKERRATLLDVAWAIGHMVGVEQAERQTLAAEDSVEAQWREAYHDADELTLRRLAGDR